MADHPEGEQSTTADRTSALVAAGLVMLAVLGVVTIFSDAIAAAWSPNASAAATASPSAVAAPVAAPAAPAADGGPA